MATDDIRVVDGYERYCVDRRGHVFTHGSDNKLRELSPSINNKGYLKVSLYKNGKSKTFYVHRLVAQAFLTNPNGLPMVNHKDFDKTNNNIENLEYCSARYNMVYSARANIHSSSYIGVTWDKSRRKWVAQYQVGRRKVFLGRYITQEEAHEAYVNAINEIWYDKN